MEKKEVLKKCPACKKGKVEKISFDEFIDEITGGRGEQIKKDLKKINSIISKPKKINQIS